MKTIKPLPESVRGSMRSGVIMFDMTRVVEELIFNSLDAGATKVSIFVGVVTCSVKVMDDGSGISRDDLVLAGARYATSKLHGIGDVETASESFGFRGEALASISDISLLEITTKAIGKPNGYRKVIKGSRCLYLGIDDDRKDSGTTVVVRDLFYNQPVRRKYMQSSPKKVLDSIKKCVHRIALVHSNISFSVLDIESDEELLQTNPSSSALSLLMRGSGTEDLTSLHKVNACDGVIKISGYISGPGDNSAMKAFQHVYINSRFISKGPIHKLLNHLAASFECVDPWKPKDGGQTGKRSSPQSNPAYLLCLTCPRNLYSFSFEPSKTYVEFKNWNPILTFIEKVILALWKEDTCVECVGGEAYLSSRGKTHKHADDIIMVEEDWAEIVECTRKRLRRNDHQTSSNLLLSPFEDQKREVDLSCEGKYAWTPQFELEKKNKMLKEQDPGGEFGHCTDTHLKSWDIEIPRSEDFLRTLDVSDLLVTSLATGRKSSKHCIKTHPVEEIPKIDCSFRQEPEELTFRLKSFDDELDVSNYVRKQLLRGCSSRGISTLNEPIITNEEGTESLIPVLETGGDCLCYDGNADIFEPCGRTMTFDSSPRTSKQDDDLFAPQRFQQSKRVGMGEDFDSLSKDAEQDDDLFAPQRFQQSKRVGMGEDFDSLSKDAAEFSPYEETVVRKKFVSVAQVGNSGAGCCFLGSESSHVCFDPPSETMWDFNDYACHEVLGGNSRLQRRLNYGNFFNEDNNLEFDDDVMPHTSCQETGAVRHADSFVDRKYYTYLDESLSKFTQEHANSAGIARYGIKSNEFTYRDGTQSDVHRQRSRRGHSAPPFYRQKKRFISLSCWLETALENSYPYDSHNAYSSTGDGLKLSTQSSGASRVHTNPSIVDNVVYHGRQDTVNRPDPAPDVKASIVCRRTVHSEPQEDDEVKDFISKENLDPVNSMTKWRNNSPVATVSKESRELQGQDCVLDISSGFLQHLACESLVPESINRSSLEDARVLQQVDKKFIPIIFGGTLAIVDQHAADERIRLEELRQKVLAGEARTITYLDAEQELILPEIGYQLLESYAEQIREWGWICNINAQGSKSFKKNMSIIQRQPTPVTLNAVPCILGVNLSDADLLEFLQQLADTDGSSTIPPSVHRLLNSKACRGAIMFGDSLLPSECSLIIEELKQTSLCFQCAHGRPTTVPLVKLKALHKQIAKLGSTQPWRGLQRQEIHLGRASTRLNAAKS